MNCRPTTRYPGRWTCETCGADLGDGTAPYLGTMCPGRDDSAPPVEPDDADYNRGIADAVAALDRLLAFARSAHKAARTVDFTDDYTDDELDTRRDVEDAFESARDAVAALKRGSE